ncbi:unnamed protein product, partial [Iphiclides podalirius]
MRSRRLLPALWVEAECEPVGILPERRPFDRTLATIYVKKDKCIARVSGIGRGAAWNARSQECSPGKKRRRLRARRCPAGGGPAPPAAPHVRSPR